MYMLTAAFLLQGALASAIARRAPAPYSDFTNNVVYVPPSSYPSWRTLYGRSLQLPDESLLVTWEDYPPEPVYHPVYRSTDGGASWAAFSQVHDTVNGWGMRYQPFLYTLPQAFGAYAAGTILAAGVSAPADLSQAYIDLYASTDQGASWKFVSHIAHGDGPETVQNGNAAIWEPFFLTYGGKLVCYYSDQRDPAHAQKLVMMTSTDLLSWSTPEDVVANPAYGDRPGMATVAQQGEGGRWIMTYEYCGGGPCNAYYKVADDPLSFGGATGYPVVSNDGSRTQPAGSPYVIYATAADGQGVTLMNGNSREEVFVNTNPANMSDWTMVNVGQHSAYSRELRIISVQGKQKLMLTNGGNMGSGDNNWVEVGVVEIPS